MASETKDTQARLSSHAPMTPFQISLVELCPVNIFPNDCACGAEYQTREHIGRSLETQSVLDTKTTATSFASFRQT